MRAFLREAGQAAGLMAAVVAAGIGAARLQAPGPAYPPLRGEGPVQPEIEKGREAEPAGEGAPPGDPGGGSAPPARLWLVDGFNVLHAGVLVGRDRAEWWSEARREQLLAIVERFEAEREDAEIWVVFDGPSAAEGLAREGSRVRVAFARSADEWLVKRARAAGGSVCVVTSDRQLADRARRRGAEVLSPRRFLARCGHAPA
jgi:predicted RNA-binding protein with PIN domain